jgi:hypothetical protein
MNLHVLDDSNFNPPRWVPVKPAMLGGGGGGASIPLSLQNWPIGADGVSVSVTATSQAIALADASAVDVMIDNPGPNDVFVRAGDESVAATLTGLRVPAGSLQPYRKGSGVTHLALRCKDGQTQSVVVHCGDGQ